MEAFHIFWKVCLIALIPCVVASPLDSRIINGTTAVLNNTQHQVSIRMKDLERTFGAGHVCGGSLITSNVVLTAAHCFYDDDIETFFSYQIYFVVMGTLDRFTQTKNTVAIDVAEIIYHDFHRPTFENDIALVILKKRMPHNNPAISLIPLNMETIPVGTVCQVTGWGDTENGEMSEVLMTVDLPIIDRETCSTNYEKGAIRDGMICAGFMEGGKDACQGDSGGPMVSNGRLVGIVSYGDGCASPGFPGIYTNVSYYLDWIELKAANATLSEDDDKGGSSASLISISSVVFLLGSLIVRVV